MSIVRRTLKIDYVDFWPNFDKDHNFIGELLASHFDLEISSDPELVVFSCYGGSSPNFRRFDCLRLLISWENRGWGFSDCDFAITSDINSHPDHYRFPLYAAHLASPFVQPEVDVSTLLARKSGFASVVVSNGGGTTRNRVHSLLDGYKTVSSGGQFRNNIGGRPVDNKMEFISRYKFNMAFENSSYPGYTTEKIVDALVADTIPIYWGNPEISEEFNTNRFVCYHAFGSETELLKRIIELDRNDDAYLAVMRQPWFRNGNLPSCISSAALVDWLAIKIDDGRKPVAQRQRQLVLLARRASDRWRSRSRYRGRVS